MELRRGFKSEANWYARQIRSELGIAAHDPLCPWKLAVHLGYTVKKLSEYVTAHPKEVPRLLSRRGQKGFSAVTAYGEDFSLIIHNDIEHSPPRQAADISHELAHGLLMHKPAPLIGNNGARTFNRQQEDEANWLGPALLISEEAALFIAGSSQSTTEICELYNVSNDLLQMRLGVTNAVIRVARRRAA